MKKQELIKLNNWDNKIRENTSKISDLALLFLKNDSVLFDIGANTGVFSEQILAKKNCKAYLFEPIKEYYDYCKIKFQLNKNIKITNCSKLAKFYLLNPVQFTQFRPLISINSK